MLDIVGMKKKKNKQQEHAMKQSMGASSAGVLLREFWHDMDFHHDCFMAVAILTQLSIEGGTQRPYQVDY